MQLYYTTTSGYNGEQPNPERSLGGFKSQPRLPTAGADAVATE